MVLRLQMKIETEIHKEKEVLHFHIYYRMPIRPTGSAVGLFLLA
jgi:hypothetical protein